MTSSNGDADNDGQTLDNNNNSNGNNNNNNGQFPIHCAVFHNDVHTLERLLNELDDDALAAVINRADPHGNTALHIACMLGHFECIKSLAARGASVRMKNNLGWSILDEATSYGDREIIAFLLLELEKASMEKYKSHLRLFSENFAQMNDFYMEIKVEFTSWIPLVSRILPSDTIKIWKKGHRFRVNYSLEANLADAVPKWEHGDKSLLLDIAATNGQKAVLLNNKKKTYRVMRERGPNLDTYVDMFMGADINESHMSTRTIHFEQAKNFFQYPKTDTVGKYKAKVYNIKGMRLVQKKRREHLSAEDLEQHRRMEALFTRGETTAAEANDSNREEPTHRSSLEPPPRPNLNWHQYLEADDDDSHLGRPMLTHSSTKEFNGTMSMSTDFPLSLNFLLDILVVLAPLHPTMTKVRQLCTARLPHGFPVRIELPIFKPVQVRISFQRFNWSGQGGSRPSSDSMFKIPRNYRQREEK